MKFREIFRFEFAYQLRRVWTWLIFTALVIFAFLFVRVNFVADALYADFFVNVPFLIAGTTVFGCIIWLGVAAAVAGEAAARDIATGMHPLTYTASISKAEYLGGRFLAAIVLNAMIMLAVQAGILLAIYLPGVDAEMIGPFRPAAYLSAYAFIALPNVFVATALQFLPAVQSGRAMASYLGSIILVFMAFFVASILLFKREMGTLLDPIGIRFIVEDLARLWTTIEQNTRLIALEGTILKNRFFWLVIALELLAVTYFSFRFVHRAENTWWRRRNPRRNANLSLPVSIGITPSTPISVPQVPQKYGFVFQTRQTLAIAWDSFLTIATSWAGFALLVFIPLLAIPVVLDQMESNGIPLVPTTILVIKELTSPLSAELSRWVIIPLLIIFFAGELVWRERDFGLSELTDAIPGSEWGPFLGKFLGLSLVLGLFMVLLSVAGVLAQLIMGYQEFEIILYLKIMFGLQFPEYLLFALLALVAHVLVDQKYIGHMVAIIAYVFIALASMFGVEHNLLIYGASPEWSYTEIRGFGSSLEPWLWFKFYWAAWGLLLAMVVKLFWVRGRESGFRVRLQLARRRLTRDAIWTAVASLGLILTLGGFIFHNTNVLNEYMTTSDIMERSAEYERRYGRYAHIPQPQLAASKMHIDIYPKRRAVDIHGAYQLVNHSTVAIDSIHLATIPGEEPQAIAMDREAELVVSDKKLGHWIYALKRPLQPGDSLILDFQIHVEQYGFRESGDDASVVANGTYFTNHWLPAIGYQQSRELMTPSDRREQGLSPRPMIASLYDGEARMDRSEGIVFEAVIGTDENQIAVAPGALRRTWTEGGRRYFHYSADGPIGSEWAFFSAEYAVHEEQWKYRDNPTQVVSIRIFHHPEHTTHLERMVRSIRASLDYYTRQFGPYQYNHISVVERPGNGTGMHADASLITHGEGFTLWNPKEEPGNLDLPFAIVAHEMAHQWTVPYAHVEGAPVMSESIAWYYGMKAVENARGKEQLKQLLNFMRQPHPIAPIRRGEPLLRGLDPYMSYRKGPFALYTLSEYIGDKRVNTALRRLLENHRQQNAPLATTLDLYRELQAVTPDSLQYLLHDLFKVNTFWELEIEQVTAKQTQSGAWHVTIDVEIRKLVYDSAGVETEMPIDDLVEVGVFAPAKEGESLGKPLYLQKHRLHSNKQKILVTVSSKPGSVGIDPNHLMIDLDMDDNVRKVKIEGVEEEVEEPDRI